MPNYVFIQDRESLEWSFFKLTDFWIHEEYSGRKKIKKRIYYNSIHPKPENVSAFIKQHKIIEANSEEEAWQILNSR